MSMATDIGLAPVAGREYKLFLVEVDDENRERVLAGRVSRCEINVEPEYADVRVDELICSAAIFKTSETVTVNLNLVPSEDGTYFEIVDFSQEDEEEE